MSSLFKYCLPCAAAAGLAMQVQAAVSVVSSPEDVAIRAGGSTINGTAPTILGASANSPEPGNRSVVYVFQLPASDTGFNTIESANFRFTTASALATPTYGIDLYAIPARSSPTVLVTDNYYGPLQTEVPATGATERIVNDLLAPNAPFPVGEVSTNFSTGSAFIDFLNRQYGVNGSGAGKYIFLRLNGDAVLPAETSGGTVNMSEATTGRPTLTLAFVPEPSLALAGTGMLVLRVLARRRGRQV